MTDAADRFGHAEKKANALLSTSISIRKSDCDLWLRDYG
jgi:hypothetical protein